MRRVVAEKAERKEGLLQTGSRKATAQTIAETVRGLAPETTYLW